MAALLKQQCGLHARASSLAERRPPAAISSRPSSMKNLLPAAPTPLPQRRTFASASASLGASTPRWPAPPMRGPRAPGAAIAEVEQSPQRERAARMVAEVALQIAPEFHEVDAMVARNLRRVQGAFKRAGVGSHFFAGATGYGHGDLGREALDQVFAEVVGAESAAVRTHFQSGTHAIACALFGVLRPGDELVALAGHPYDTMEEVIGLRGEENIGSLADLGVSYREVDLKGDGTPDWDAIACCVGPKTRCVLVQRSCGYDMRKSLSVEEIGRGIELIKAQNPEVVVVVDNCYGEFVEEREPCHVGADLIAGSLIKNPGGTIAPCGGYVAGTAYWVTRACARLSAPGVGQESGAWPAEYARLLFQGLWLAPQTVGEAVKGGKLVAAVFHAQGKNVKPAVGEPRSDIITAVELGSEAALLAFCRAVQRCSPIGAYIRPEPGATPGYASQVVFADGTFIDGSTSELSADGPLREPYAVFCQGGTHWSHWAWVLEEVLEELWDMEGK
mmetsp:Transcript_2788/g.9416  ORF Transcript_2788/g.9416 Transcript_2788/m.9416 type:complete len:504 (-) Transcript_2788:154-1665(-)